MAIPNAKNLAIAAASAGGTFNFTSSSSGVTADTITIQSLTAGNATLAGGGAIDGVGNLFDDTNLYLLSLNSPAIDYNDGNLVVKEGNIGELDLTANTNSGIVRVPGCTYPTGGLIAFNAYGYDNANSPSNNTVFITKPGYYIIDAFANPGCDPDEGFTQTVVLLDNVVATIGNNYNYLPLPDDYNDYMVREFVMSTAGTAIKLTFMNLNIMNGLLIQNLSDCPITEVRYI